MHTTVTTFHWFPAAGQGRNKKKGLLGNGYAFESGIQRFLGDPGKQSTEIEFLEIFLDNYASTGFP
jgi:hypothetical protein